MYIYKVIAGIAAQGESKLHHALLGAKCASFHKILDKKVGCGVEWNRNHKYSGGDYDDWVNH